MAIGRDYPLGAGYRGTGALSKAYMPAWVLNSAGARSAHNTFAAVFAEHGYFGAALYVLLVLWVVLSLWRTRLLPKQGVEVLDHAIMVALLSALVGMYVSGNFSNNFFTETQYWLLALVCCCLTRFSVGLTEPQSKPLEVTPSSRYQIKR